MRQQSQAEEMGRAVAYRKNKFTTRVVKNRSTSSRIVKSPDLETSKNQLEMAQTTLNLLWSRALEEMAPLPTQFCDLKNQ